jgi:hypothetical protein
VHLPNIIRLPRTQWYAVEGRLRDCLRRMGVPLRHSVGAGCDFVVCRFFDDSGQLLQTKYVFSTEALAKMLADDG